jgi:hypothetical protein
LDASDLKNIADVAGSIEPVRDALREGAKNLTAPVGATIGGLAGSAATGVLTSAGASVSSGLGWAAGASAGASPGLSAALGAAAAANPVVLGAVGIAGLGLVTVGAIAAIVDLLDGD